MLYVSTDGSFFVTFYRLLGYTHRQA